jgi:hypothetical protein
MNKSGTIVTPAGGGDHAMTRRGFVTACCVLLSAVSMFAQSRGATADPLSGTWKGEFVPHASDGVPITMELKFDGKSVVSGSVTGLPNPGEVKIGTVDRKTGALKLQLGKIGDAAVLLVLEGTVVKGTATGRISGEVTGDFTLAKRE